MASTDTSEEARQRQLDFYLSTPGADKVLLASEMAEQAKQIAIDGIRSRNPVLSDAAIHVAWLEMLYGDLARRIIGKNPAKRP